MKITIPTCLILAIMLLSGCFTETIEPIGPIKELIVYRNVTINTTIYNITEKIIYVNNTIIQECAPDNSSGRYNDLFMELLRCENRHVANMTAEVYENEVYKLQVQYNHTVALLDMIEEVLENR